MDDKKKALRILIEHDFVLSPVLHEKLLEKIDTYSEEQIDTIGFFLADLKRGSLAYNEEALAKIDQFLKDDPS